MDIDTGSGTRRVGARARGAARCALAQPGEVCPSIRRESAHLVPFSTVGIGTVVQPWRHRPTKAVLKGDYPTPTMGQDPVAALDPTLGR